MAQAGYSATPLAKKLGIGADDAFALVSAPAGTADLLAPLPAGAHVVDRPEKARVAIWFVGTRSELAAGIHSLAQAVFPDRALWVAWPKRTSGVATDVTEDVVRELALPLGLVDNKVCAIDATWSGLRLVWRRELRTRR